MLFHLEIAIAILLGMSISVPLRISNVFHLEILTFLWEFQLRFLWHFFPLGMSISSHFFFFGNVNFLKKKFSFCECQFLYLLMSISFYLVMSTFCQFSSLSMSIFFYLVISFFFLVNNNFFLLGYVNFFSLVNVNLCSLRKMSVLFHFFGNINFFYLLIFFFT